MSRGRSVNPVIRVDEGGEFWHILVGAAIGATIQYVYDVTANIMKGEKGLNILKPTSSAADYLASAASGALAATGIGTAGQVIGNATISAADYTVNKTSKGEKINGRELVGHTIIGAVSGRIGGSGANGKALRGISSTSKKILKNAVSPKKIAQYSAKLKNIPRVVGIGIARSTIGGGFATIGKMSLSHYSNRRSVR